MCMFSSTLLAGMQALHRATHEGWSECRHHSVLMFTLFLAIAPLAGSYVCAVCPVTPGHHLFCMLDTTEFKLSHWKEVWYSAKEHPVVDWRAFVTVTSNRATPISNFICATRLSFSILIHVLGAAPIKAHFDHAYIIVVLIRTAFWCWNYSWGAPLLETLLHMLHT